MFVCVCVRLIAGAVKLPDEMRRTDSGLKLHRSHRSKIMMSINALIKYVHVLLAATLIALSAALNICFLGPNIVSRTRHVATRLPSLSKPYVTPDASYYARLDSMLGPDGSKASAAAPSMPASRGSKP